MMMLHRTAGKPGGLGQMGAGVVRVQVMGRGLRAGAQQAGQVAQNASDYQRAMSACVEGRGYSAR